MNFHSKYPENWTVPKWRKKEVLAQKAIKLIRNKSKSELTKAERKIIKRAKELTEYWELLEEENQPNVVVGQPPSEPITPQEPDILDLIISGGIINE